MKNTLQRAALSTALLASCAGLAQAQSLIYTLPGNAPGDGFGEASRAAGDLDGDGVCDLILGSRAGILGTGYARVVSGTNGMLIREFTGSGAGDRFGTAVDGVGDLDGDLVPDVIVGAALAGSGARGEASVFSGSDGSVIHALSGAAPGDHFGWSVVGLSDLDGDLVPEFAVGAVDSGASTGMVRVFSGATGTELRTHTGVGPNELFGYALAALPDVDGDLVGELLVGAPSVVKLGAVTTGYATLFSGATGAVIDSWSGHTANDAFGRAVANAGDVDGDGIADAIVGAPQPMPGSTGYARVFSGLTGSLVYDWAGDSGGDHFGASVASAGDVNSDLQGEVAIGAPGDDDNGQNSGSVRVISGQGGLPLFTIYGESANQELGSSLDGGDDINGDGTLDLVIAVPGDPASGAATGSARVLSPRALPLCAPAHTLSFKSIGAMPLHIDAGAAHAGHAYELLGSITGVSPGTVYGGLNLALNRGRYFKFTEAFNPNGPISPPVGVLDAQGTASAGFMPPRKASSKWLVGRTFHHALVVFDSTGTAVLTSNPWPVTIVP